MESFLKRLILVGVILVSVQMNKKSFVVSAGASEWSMGPPTEDYTKAFINLTYMEGDKIHTEKSDVGKFGAGKVGPASGIVVHVFSVNKTDSHYGCDYPYGNQLPNEPWIALVKRGNCSFDRKLEIAFRSNASALVVYAKEDKDQLEKMSFKNCNYCDIPTVFTYRWKGEEIAKNVDRGYRVQMYITVGETCSRPYSGINRTSVLFVSISFIVLMIISLAWLVFYYVQRFRYLHAKDRLALRLCYAAKKALAKIPTRNIKLTDKEISGEGECCAVCIELYRSGETLRTLPCRHEFHKCCVDPWLLEHRTCPMCKMDILKYYGFIFTGSQESILHLDMEDGMLNSSESRETETPIQETLHHHHHTHTRAQHHASMVPAVAVSTVHGFDDQSPHSALATATVQQAVVASHQGTITSGSDKGNEIQMDHDKTFLKTGPLKSGEMKKSSSKSSLPLDESTCHDLCQGLFEDEHDSCSHPAPAGSADGNPDDLVTPAQPESVLPSEGVESETGSLTPKSQHGSVEVSASESPDSTRAVNSVTPAAGDESSHSATSTNTNSA